MLLSLSKWCLRLALFTPLIVTPLFFFSSGFAFPANGFFPFIALKAIYFRVVIEAALFFFILHLLFSATRRVQIAAVMRKLRRPIALAIMAFATTLLFTGLLGENPSLSVWSNFERGEGVFQIMHYCLFFLLAYVLFTNKEEIKRLINLNLIVSFFVCLYAMPQFFGIQEWTHTIGGSGRISGTLGNPSYLAAYLLFNFALIAYAYLQKPARKTRIWLIALAAFEFFAFINTGTRAAYLALAVGLAVIYCINIFITKNSETRSRLIIILVGVVAFGATGLGAYHAFPELQKGVIFDRLFNFSGAVKGFEPRGWTWQSALSGISDRPLLGWGAENFAYSFDQYYNPKHYGGESFFDRTHNIFLEHLISGGIVLLLVYLSFWYFYYREMRGREKNIWYSILIAMPIVYFVQGFFLFDVLPVYLITFLFVVVALNADAAPENTELSEDGYTMGHAELMTATGLMALLIFTIVVTAIIPWKKNLLITRAYSMPTDNPEASFNAFQEAITYKSLVGQEEAVSGLMKFSIDLLDAAAQQQVAVPQEIVRGIVDTNNIWFDTYRSIMPGVRDWYLNGGLNLRAGLSFGLPEYEARGRKMYTEALAYSPTRIEFIQLLLEVARSTGNKEEFEMLLARAKELRPDIIWQEMTPAPAGN
jgi:O-antigen ligase